MSTMTTTVTDTHTGSKGLHIALWVVQALLAVAFLLAGGTKVLGVSPANAMLGTGLATFIGLAEVAGALGLVLPGLTRIAPRLVGLAALGLFTVMALAVGFHLTQGHPVDQSVPALVLGALSGFVAWGRLKARPITPR